MFSGGRTKRNNRDSPRHGTPMGPPIRHDHHQQRHPTCLPTTPERDQQPGTRTPMGPSALAQAHLARNLWRQATNDKHRYLSTLSLQLSDRFRYVQTRVNVRYYYANGFTFAFLLSKRLRRQKTHSVESPW